MSEKVDREFLLVAAKEDLVEESATQYGMLLGGNSSTLMSKTSSNWKYQLPTRKSSQLLITQLKRNQQNPFASLDASPTH